VLELLLEGLTNKRIAERLCITEGAVKSTLQALFEKTNVRTRAQLVRVALEVR
jgi:DNA-binding NarL/FixJ family response regulator